MAKIHAANAPVVMMACVSGGGAREPDGSLGLLSREFGRTYIYP